MVLSTGRVVRRSAWFHRSMGIAVGLGVAAATAVVCGALLVGDSMRGSLKSLTLQRLGAIDEAVIPGGFFKASRVAADLPEGSKGVAIIQFARAVVESENVDGVGVRRSGNVQIVASDSDFWDLDTYGVRPDTFPSGDEIVVNEATANELGIQVGDLVTVRLPSEQAVPADSPLGRRESDSEGIPRLKVVAIVPNKGLGRFSLQPSQSVPQCAFLPIELVRSVLERPDAANTLLVSLGGSSTILRATDTGDRAGKDALTESLRPGLADFGLQLERVSQTFGDGDAKVIFDYYSVTSERLLISDRIVDIILSEIGSELARPVMTYLANGIETPDGKRSVPYSTITAIDSAPDLPLDFSLPSNADDDAIVPVVLNSWIAERLEAKVGDRVRIFYFEPETSSGRELEKDFSATVSEIVSVTRPKTPFRRSRPAIFDQAPTVYNDPHLTPTVPGVTDQDSINDWDLPFQLEREISRDDDDYWAEYRLTPKAFIPLQHGQQIFASRFGNVSSIRIETAAAEDLQTLENRIVAALRKDQAALGFASIPIKAQQLEASRGTTPFDALFLSLSFFVIVAALMLVSLLFRLGMEQRAAEYGTMMALGIPGPKVARMAMSEGTLVAVPGALLGAVGGIGYAMLVLYGLKTLWVGAVTVPFLEFHWTPLSLIGGFVAGIAMAALTILVTTRRLRRAEIRPLLSGMIPQGNPRFWNATVIRVGGIACLVAAVLLGVFAVTLSGPAQAGAFVGGGMLLMCGMLALIYNGLTSWAREDRRLEIPRTFSLTTLAIRSVGRNPLRSTLSVGLMSVACFLIVSMSAFQMSPTERGIGGFDLIGQSAVPVYKDLGDPKVQSELLGRDAGIAAGAKIFGLRFRPGQEASCNNLYQATQPQVLGVPESMAKWFARELPPNSPSELLPNSQNASEQALLATDFDWAARGSKSVDDEAVLTPWQLLNKPAKGTADDPVPLILDQNTAMWSLQMRGGVGEVRSFVFDDGRERFFKVVALLGNTILQGSLLIGEDNFESLFPSINGYSYFLMQLPGGQDREAFATMIEGRMGDIGLDATDSRELLSNLMAVQNTYLKTFQSLGALGLLLGTFGLAVVQLRNVLERRGELALMRAIGFSRARLAMTVMAENATLLLTGVACGAGAALAAVIPYFIASSSSPNLSAPLWMLGIVTVVGLLAALLSVRRVLKMRLLDAL
jgi:putative ABC transport system permease protein